MILNKSGAELGPNGFVICRTCRNETKEISRETSQQFAFCLQHKRGLMKTITANESNVKSGSLNSVKLLVEKSGGMLREDIWTLCMDNKLSKKSAYNMICVLKKIGLVRK